MLDVGKVGGGAEDHHSPWRGIQTGCKDQRMSVFCMFLLLVSYEVVDNF